MEKKQQQQHILVASYPAQGHINPTLQLAKRLAGETAARITFSTAVSAHRRMFPNQEPPPLSDNLFSYIPYSNGYDDGIDDRSNFLPYSQQQSSESLAAILDDLAARGRPVTCIIYSFFMSWAAELARVRNIPSFLFWIQPATAFAVYWHYFHGFPMANLPGMPPMRISDLPSFITDESPDDFYATILTQIRYMFDTLDAQMWKPRVIANTADEMEAAAIASVAEEVDIVGIGPLSLETGEGSLFKSDEKSEYMNWLDRQAERSVVYVSFGSLLVLKKEQVEEIRRGLKRSGRPYLWVVRKDNGIEGVVEAEEEEEEEKKGMVVEWCRQGRVLGHRAVGCFVTHCGWNSTVESLQSGVPTVAVPRWSDQLTNAWLVEKAWGTGVRVEAGEDGLVEAGELQRCVEMVMGNGEISEEIRRQAEIWRKKACQATVGGGSSDRNLKAFFKEIAG